jgi:hypothetical protein
MVDTITKDPKKDDKTNTLKIEKMKDSLLKENKQPIKIEPVKSLEKKVEKKVE